MATGFAVLMAYEWSRWPNGSVLLGPLGFIWYNGLDPCSAVVTAVLLPMVLAFPLRPHPGTLILSLFGLLVWLFMGELALGIGC